MKVLVFVVTRLERFVVVLVAWVLLATNAGPVFAMEQDRWAPLASPVFRNYGSDEGLPNPVATAISESDDGFLWIGTEGGLAHWDGYHFRNYRQVVGDAGALPDSWITALHSDAAGRLWVGTSSGGLARYDRDRDRFITYPVGAGGLSNAHIWSIADDGARGVWVASEGGLDHVDPASGRITTLQHRANDPAGLPDNRVRALLRDRTGTLWVGTGGGLVTLSKFGRFRPVPVGGATPSAATIVSCLTEDGDGDIWIGTAHHGAFVMGPRENIPRPVLETAGEALGGSSEDLADEWVYALTQAGPNEMWLGTYGRGIVAVDIKTGRTHRIVHDPLVRQSLADNTIWALHRDRAGNLWVGTNVGLDLLSDARGAALTVFGNTSNPRGLSEGDVLALRVASNGRVWAGLHTKGIDILDPVRGRVTNIAPDSKKPESALPQTPVHSLTEWTKGQMFVADNFGLYRTDFMGSRVTRVTFPGRDPAARTSAVDLKGRQLWILGMDDGLWSVSLDKPARAPVEHYDLGELSDSRGMVLANGPAGVLWIGTRNGLNRLDVPTRKIERIVPHPTDSKGLANGFITTLLLDHFGRLWVGTEGGGIAILVRREAGRPVFERIGVEQGLPDNNVDSLMADRGGRIWAATDNGIAVIDPADLRIHTLGRADGLAISAYWVGSGAATKQGELLFGGAGGLTVIRPDHYRPWTYHPPVVVTRAVVGGKNVPTGDGAPLSVQPDANSLAVEFSALDYSAPERNRYAYRLDGFDRGWVATDATGRIAAYTNLPPGTYTLRLRGSNREGEWTESTVNLPIRVLPNWYQTTLCKIAIALLTVFGIVALIQARTSYLRQRQRELEQQVAARTLELHESKLQIEQIAYLDALTGLPNRRLFNTEIQKLIARAQRQSQRFSLLLIDLDRFKEVNDTLGHDAGDALLVEAAKRMQSSLRVSDRLFRLGGDEFAILIEAAAGAESADKDATNEVCQRILRCFDAAVLFNNAKMKTSASVGIGVYPTDGTTWESLFKASDLALYEAKRSGRNTWRWYESTVAHT